ncbi:MAG: DHH family phosphoesterase, partial [Clostridiales bacterium]|nr:DHH family phosphoesterase [Clostridiales bacterium]
MGQNIKLKGKLKSYITLPLWLTILFAALTVWIWYLDWKAGLLCAVFVAVYFILMWFSYQRSRHVILNEMIDFATQYGKVQRRLLDDFEIPYAILDQNARLMWMNRQFDEVAGKQKSRHPSITSIFPQITKDRLRKEDRLTLKITKDDRIFRASVSKVFFSDVLDSSTGLEGADPDQYLTVIYLFDETLLNQYLR